MLSRVNFSIVSELNVFLIRIITREKISSSVKVNSVFGILS